MAKPTTIPLSMLWRKSLPRKESYMIVALVIAAVFYFALGEVLITALTEIVGSREEAKKVLKGAVIFVLCIAIVISALTE